MNRVVSLGRRAFGPSGERGAVTAELAVALPTLFVVVGVVIAGIAWAGQVVRCENAAGELARAIARDEPPERVEALADRLTPPGAAVTREGDGELITVRVRWTPPPDAPPWSRLAPAIDVEESAVVPR